MEPKDVDAVAWLEPWVPVEEQHREATRRALQRELVAGHVLFGREARAIARRYDGDDVLFAVEGPTQFAVVHLAYAREKAPEWPRTMIFETIGHFIEGCMLPDHQEFTDEDVDD